MDLAGLSHKIKQASEDFQREEAEARGIIEQQEKQTLDFCARLLAIIRVVVDEKKTLLPNRGWRVIVVSLAAKVISTTRATLTVATAGHAGEADILARSALEALITACFIAQRSSAQRARRWAQYGDIQKSRVFKSTPIYLGSRNTCRHAQKF